MSKSKKLRVVGPVVTMSGQDFGHQFYMAHGATRRLAMQGLAMYGKNFGERRKMKDTDVKAIDTGIQLGVAEDWEAKGYNRFVRDADTGNLIHVNVWERKNGDLPKTGGPAVVTVKVDEAMRQTKMTLEALKGSDATLQAAYVFLRDQMATRVANTWGRIRAALADAKSIAESERTGKPIRRNPRGKTKPLGETVAAFLDGLVKKAKLRHGDDASAPDPVKVAAFVTRVKKEWAALTA